VRVAYRADQSANERYELFLAPLDGSAAAQLLTLLSSGGQVFPGYQFAADGSHLVYEADTGGATPEDRLFSVRTSDGVVAALHVESVASFQISTADAEVDGLIELYSAPSDGSGPPVKLNGNLRASIDPAASQPSRAAQAREPTETRMY